MPTRVAFVGKLSAFGDCALSAPAGDVVPRFFDSGVAGGDVLELRAALDDWSADAVVVFRPQDFEAGTFARLRASTLGIVDEPVFRGPGGDPRGPQLSAAVAADLDRVIACDPDAEQTAATVWRSRALPVDDRIFAEPNDASTDTPRALFVGESSAHRERFLINSKHEFDVLHYAHGLHGEELREVFARCDVGINLHPEPYASFDGHFLAHLAAGHLLLSEPLSHTHGLEPGIDFVEVRRPDELTTALAQLARRPQTYDRVRLRGRAKAEEHRASRVWPRLVDDLLRDLKVFGTPRAA